MGRDSSVGITTHYELDGPAIESRWELRFFHTRPNRPWSPPSLLYNGYRFFPEGKAAGAWLWPPTPSIAEVKERVEIYIYSVSVPSRPVLGRTLLLVSVFGTNASKRMINVNVIFELAFVSNV